MGVFIALLRAVNVGGTNKLPMSELRELCEGIGFSNVTTYIQSGNVVFTSNLATEKAKEKLEAALKKKMKTTVGVYIRTPKEIEAIIKRNPFKRAESNRVLVYFLDDVHRRDACATVSKLKVPGREEVKHAGREVFVHYPDGMGRSKLKLSFSKDATARNMNTIKKLLEIAHMTMA